jgi:hypothetical protein
MQNFVPPKYKNQFMELYSKLYFKHLVIDSSKRRAQYVTFMKKMKKLLNSTFNSSKPEFSKSELSKLENSKLEPPKSQLMPLKLCSAIIPPAKSSKIINNPETSSKETNSQTKLIIVQKDFHK